MFARLQKEGKIGKLTMTNRLVMLPTVTQFAASDGTISARQINYYARRAAGVALVIAEAAYVHPLGKFFARQTAIDRDDTIPGLSELAAAIHAAGSKAGIQLAMHNPQVIPAQFTLPEIDGFVQAFADAARRAAVAGFDLVEIHLAHGWFLGQFLAANTNGRTDEYGGSFTNRARLPLRVLAAVREAVPELAVSCRINADDFVAGGFPVEEAVLLAELLQAGGADIISVSAGTGQSSEWHIAPMALPDRPLAHLLARIKKRVGIPVLAANKLGLPDDWEKLLQDGSCDFIGIARGLIADPDLAMKVMEGRLADIVPCIHCNQACIANILRGRPVACMVNPEAGREKKWALAPAPEGAGVTVVGGGPAGMMAAIYARRRGYRVDLFEQERELGGQLNLASRPPHKGEIQNLRDYLVREVSRLGVQVYLNTRMDSGLLQSRLPGKVIIATGSVPLLPSLPGVNASHVLLADDVLATPEKAAGRRVVVIGGGLTGLESAEFLAAEGKDVTVVEMLEEVADGVFPMVRKLLLQRLNQHGVRILKNTSVLSIEAQGVRVNIHGREEFLPAEQVVLAVGRRPLLPFNNHVNHIDPGEMGTVVLAGDCREVNTAVEAIREGAEAGSQI